MIDTEKIKVQMNISSLAAIGLLGKMQENKFPTSGDCTDEQLLQVPSMIVELKNIIDSTDLVRLRLESALLSCTQEEAKALIDVACLLEKTANILWLLSHRINHFAKQLEST